MQGVVSFAEWLNGLLSRRLAQKKKTPGWIEARRERIAKTRCTCGSLEEVNADCNGEQRAGSVDDQLFVEECTETTETLTSALCTIHSPRCRD